MEIIEKILFYAALAIIIYPIARSFFQGLWWFVSFSEYRTEVNKRKLAALREGLSNSYIKELG